MSTAATTNGDVYVSIIPFVKDVNLGSSNYTAAWIDWTDWDANNGTCSGAGGGYGGGGGGYGSSNGSMGATQATWSGTWKPKNHNTWNGCVMDRGRSTAPDAANYDTKSCTNDGNHRHALCRRAIQLLPAGGDGAELQLVVHDLVGQQYDAERQHQPGDRLAARLDVSGRRGPFTAPAMDPNYTYQQIIILLTDGLNTQDRWYSNQSRKSTRVSN